MTTMHRTALTLLALALGFGPTAASAAPANSASAIGVQSVAAAANSHSLIDLSDFGVRIVKGSRINLVSSQSRLPIKIRNDYETDVRVYVWTQPDVLWISMPKATEVTIPAMTTITATVPIEAISNGDTKINAYLSSFSGVRMGTSVWIDLRVERDIEPAILATFFVVVGVLGFIGGRRMVRRRRGASE